jgi:hypothetical protein
MKAKTFKQVNVGEEFTFLSEVTMPYSGMKKGPWRKISARKYVHVEDGMECRVGSVNVQVCH